MAALPEKSERSARGEDSVKGQEAAKRSRYVRAPQAHPQTALTTPKLEMLRFLCECRFLSLPQLARLVCPSVSEGASKKAAQRHLRVLFDAGLVDVLPVSRAALASAEAPNDASLLYGSAPNIYAPTRQGFELACRAGLADSGAAPRRPLDYGPKNGLFLAHELQVRDVRVWLEDCAREHGGDHQVLRWTDGTEAALPYGNGCARPDAWFVYQIKARRDGNQPVILVGLVEVDRGTERGERHWSQKVRDYAGLFESGALAQLTGYRNARVLVLTPDVRRRDGLASLIESQEPHSFGASRSWLAARSVLSSQTLSEPAWKCGRTVQPLVAAEVLAAAPER